MIIFGSKTTERFHEGAVPAYCPHCDNQVNLAGRESRRWGHIYRVPLVPLESKQRELVCPVCFAATETLEKDTFGTVKELSALRKRYEDGEDVGQLYQQRLDELDILKAETAEPTEVSV